jgi:hypothetical protein
MVGNARITFPKLIWGLLKESYLREHIGRGC